MPGRAEGSNQPEGEAREQAEGGQAVPVVQVAIPQVGEEAGEPDGPRCGQGPPRPAPAGPQRTIDEPPVRQSDGDQGSAEGGPVVDHEVDHPAAVPGAQVAGGHPQEPLVVRQEAAGRGQPERTQPGPEEARGREPQRPPAGHGGNGIVAGRHGGVPGGRPPEINCQPSAGITGAVRPGCRTNTGRASPGAGRSTRRPPRPSPGPGSRRRRPPRSVDPRPSGRPSRSRLSASG